MNRQAEIERTLLTQLRMGKISRREFLIQMFAAGLAVGGLSTLTSAPWEASVARAQEERILTPTFYQWIVDLHPGIKEEVNPAFPGGVNFQIAPVEGFDVARFVAEAKRGESTWDVYIGMTPFVEMAGLIKAGVIEPWDPYLPEGVLDDLMPSIREECSVDGKLYSWPFLIDVIVQAWNNSITSEAGIEDKPPADWDEYLANAKIVVDKGTAPYGCTFDAHGWRSLAPITHSISTDCYYMLEGDTSGYPLYDFTGEPALQALEVLKQMLELSSANALQPGTTDGGVNYTPDEVAFAAQRVAYYIKYQNAPLRFAQRWPDPGALRMGALPKAKGGEGATVFWTTGACLFKHGQNKEKAAEYLKALTYNMRIWKDSIAGSPSGQPGQLPPFQSIWDQLKQDNPDWLQANAWVWLVIDQMKVAKAIPNHKYGLQQFIIGQPHWQTYLTGEEPDPKVAMQAAKDAVVEEMKKVGDL
jgi:ABC-type glycerol-3-phosphate transport system substrate-binding protein